MSKVLIVDDEESIIDSLTMVLTSEGHEVHGCLNGQTAINRVIANEYDLVLLDIKMPKMDGMEVLEKIMDINRDLVVIMISGHGTIETAVEATKKGAYNFMLKPLPDLPELKVAFRNAIEFKKSKDQLRRVRKQMEESNRIIGNSTRITFVKDLIKKFAQQNQNVLITGESGTGKEIIARQIHLESGRAEKPFVVINSANLSHHDTDKELFGSVYEDKLNSGKFDLADGGTIFFDEIASLSTEIQARLLEVIENRTFVRSGASTNTYVDVRFIFATNADPEEELAQKNLREDFYHRINVLRINVPPLRERSEDIPALVEYFAENTGTEGNIRTKKFSPGAIDLLMSFRWPGNVRELRNLVERLIITLDKKIVEPEDIELPGTKHLKEFSELFNRNMSLNEFQNESERIFLLKMLNDYKYNISQTASALQIQRSHLYKLMSKYDIPTPSKIKES